MESSDERYCSPLILLKGGQPPGAKSSRLRMFESVALNREAGSSPLPGTSESSDLWSNPKMTLPFREFARSTAAFGGQVDRCRQDPIILESSRKNTAQQVRGRAAGSQGWLRTRSKAVRSGGKPLRIFDNQVEHASRENTERSGLIILTMLELHDLFSSIVKPIPPEDLRRRVGIIRFQTRV